MYQWYILSGFRYDTYDTYEVIFDMYQWYILCSFRYDTYDTHDVIFDMYQWYILCGFRLENLYMLTNCMEIWEI